MDEVLDTEWSSVKKDMRVRWILPNSVRRGKVLKVKNRSMRVMFDGHVKATVIPDARDYFDQHRLGNEMYALCIIEGDAPEFRHVELPIAEDTGAAHHARITPTEAAAFLGTDPKNIRRMIRLGTLPAEKRNGSWTILRKDLNR